MSGSNDEMTLGEYEHMHTKMRSYVRQWKQDLLDAQIQVERGKDDLKYLAGKIAELRNTNE